MSPSQLRSLLRDLFAIEDNGQLSELLLDFRAECQERGGLPAADERARTETTMQVDSAFRAKEIGKAAAFMFGLQESECVEAARDVLLMDPWAQIAIRLIREYQPQPLLSQETADAHKGGSQRAW